MILLLAGVAAVLLFVRAPGDAAADGRRRLLPRAALVVATIACVNPLVLVPLSLGHCLGTAEGCQWRGAAYVGLMAVPGLVAVLLALYGGWRSRPRSWARRYAQVLLIALAVVDLALLSTALG